MDWMEEQNAAIVVVFEADICWYFDPLAVGSYVQSEVVVVITHDTL